MSSITINITDGYPPFEVIIKPLNITNIYPDLGTYIINDLELGDYEITTIDGSTCFVIKNISLTTTTTTTTTTTSTTTTTTTTEQLAALVLTWEDINTTPVNDAYSLNDWNTLFDLPNYGNPFTEIIVEGNVVYLLGGSNISIKDGIFSNAIFPLISPTFLNGFLISIVDLANCVVETGEYSFGYAPNVDQVYSKLETIDLPNLSYTGTGTAYYNTALVNLNLPNLLNADDYSFYSCTAITEFNLPILLTAGNYCFSNTTSVVTYYFPELTTAGHGCILNMYNDTCNEINLPSCISVGNFCFKGNWNISIINLPVVETLGDTTALSTGISIFDNPAQDILVDGYVPEYLITAEYGNDVFGYIEESQSITLTINSDLLTINSGNPDNDIAALLYASEQWRRDPITGFTPRNHYGNNVTIIPV
jgi:hypothetical protein